MSLSNSNLYFIAPLHKRGTGADVISREILKHFNDEKNLKIYIVSTNFIKKRGFFIFWFNFFIHFLRFIKLFICSLLQKNNYIYFSLPDGLGIIYLFLYIPLYPLLKKVVIHHHSFKHLKTKKLFFIIFFKVFSKISIHYTLCPSMKNLLTVTYNQKNVLILSNAVFFNLNYLNKYRFSNYGKKINFGFYGRLSFSKGIYDFIKIAKEFPEANFFVAGSLVNFNSYSFSHIKNINFIGFLNDQDKINFFNMIDLLIYPSFEDAEPLVIYESIENNVPVISYDVGCINNILNNEYIFSGSDKIKFNKLRTFIQRLISDNFFRDDFFIKYKPFCNYMQKHMNISFFKIFKINENS